MVVFTCNHCGESIQKPRVVKHYQTTCRRPVSLTCIDCLKDFRLEEYVSHTKCLTEDQRYSAKGTVHKVLKGELKQATWVETVNAVIEEQKNAKPNIKYILEMVQKQAAIPRKQRKFINFLKSAMGIRVNMNDIEEVWNLIETHTKNITQNGTSSKQEENNKNETIKTNGDDATANKKKRKSKTNSDEMNSNNEENKSENTEPVSKKKKQRSKSNSLENTTSQNKNEENVPENKSEVNESDSVSKKKKRKSKMNSEENGNSEIIPQISKEENQPKTNGMDSITKKKKRKSKNNLEENDTEKVIPQKKMKSAEKNKTETEGPDSITKKKKQKSKNNLEQNDTVEITPKQESIEENKFEINCTDSVSKKKKKRNSSINSVENDTKETSLEKSSENEPGNAFMWKESIFEILGKRPEGLSQTNLEKKILKRLEKTGCVKNPGRVLKKLHSKIKSFKNIKLENGTYKLVE